MSSRGGRVPGSEGYNDADIRALLICVGEVRPTSKREWLRVLKLYRKRYAEPQMRSLRDVNSIKSKFRQILNIKSKAGSGKPHPSAMEAHKIQLEIQMRLHSLMADGAHGGTADDASDLSDSDPEAMSSTTAPAALAAPPLFGADAAQAPSAETNPSTAAAAVVRASPSRQPHLSAVAQSLPHDGRTSPHRRVSAPSTSSSAQAARLLAIDSRSDDTTDQLVMTRLATLEQQNIALNARLHAMNDSAQQVLAARVETLEQQNSALTARLHTVSDAADALKTTNFDLREQILQLQTEFARIEAENRELRAGAGVMPSASS